MSSAAPNTAHEQLDPRHILKLQREKKELDDMFVRRGNQPGSTAQSESIYGHPPTCLKKGVHFESGAGAVVAVATTTTTTTTTTTHRSSNKRRTTTSFLASMNFQDNHKRLKLAPQKPEEGQITWSNVYDAEPLTQVPKINLDDTRGPLLLFAGTATTDADIGGGPESPPSTTTNGNGAGSWKELVDAIPAANNDKSMSSGEDTADTAGKESSIGKSERAASEEDDEELDDLNEQLDETS